MKSKIVRYTISDEKKRSGIQFYESFVTTGLDENTNPYFSTFYIYFSLFLPSILIKRKDADYSEHS
jgi:hypothetical protein